MKYFIKKCTLLALTLFLMLSAVCLYETKVIAVETQYIKITVEEYVGHEADYEPHDGKVYLLCGIVDHVNIYENPGNVNPGQHIFWLNSFNQLDGKEAKIWTCVDSYSEHNERNFNNHFGYLYGYETTLVGKYVEFMIKNNYYNDYISDRSSKTIGVVYSDFIDQETMGVTYGNLSGARYNYTTHKPLSSMKFDYDLTGSNSLSTYQVWRKVYVGDTLDSTATYTLGYLASYDGTLKFIVDPANGDTYSNDYKFSYALARLSSDKFTVVYSNTEPAHFKMEGSWSQNLTISYDKNDFHFSNTSCDYINAEGVKMDSEQDQVKISNIAYDEELYIFKLVEDYDYTKTTPNYHIEYDPNSLSIRFLNAIDSQTYSAINNSCSLIKSVVYGMKVSIEGREDQFVEFSNSEISRVEAEGSNVKVEEGGFLQAILTIKKIPMSAWDTKITVTPYVKLSYNSFTCPTDKKLTFEMEDLWLYQKSVTRSVSSLAEDYYLEHGKEAGVSEHLLALKEIAEKTAKVREAK